jgi:hypothetical protein
MSAPSLVPQVPCCCVISGMGMTRLPGSTPGGAAYEAALRLLQASLQGSQLRLFGPDGFTLLNADVAPAATVTAAAGAVAAADSAAVANTAALMEDTGMAGLDGESDETNAHRIGSSGADGAPHPPCYSNKNNSSSSSSHVCLPGAAAGRAEYPVQHILAPQWTTAREFGALQRAAAHSCTSPSTSASHPPPASTLGSAAAALMGLRAATPVASASGVGGGGGLGRTPSVLPQVWPGGAAVVQPAGTPGSTANAQRWEALKRSCEQQQQQLQQQQQQRVVAVSRTAGTAAAMRAPRSLTPAVKRVQSGADSSSSSSSRPGLTPAVVAAAAAAPGTVARMQPLAKRVAKGSGVNWAAPTPAPAAVATPTAKPSKFSDQQQQQQQPPGEDSAVQGSRPPPKAPRTKRPCELDASTLSTKASAALDASGGSSLRGLTVAEMTCLLRARGLRGGPTKRSDVEARLLPLLLAERSDGSSGPAGDDGCGPSSGCNSACGGAAGAGAGAAAGATGLYGKANDDAQ